MHLLPIPIRAAVFALVSAIPLHAPTMDLPPVESVFPRAQFIPPPPPVPSGDCYVNVDVGYTWLRGWMGVACGVFGAAWERHGAIPNNVGAYAVITGAARHPVYEQRAERYHLNGHAMDLRTRNIRSPFELVKAFTAACDHMVELYPTFRAVLIYGKPGFGNHVHMEMRHHTDTDRPSCDFAGALEVAGHRHGEST